MWEGEAEQEVLEGDSMRAQKSASHVRQVGQQHTAKISREWRERGEERKCVCERESKATSMKWKEGSRGRSQGGCCELDVHRWHRWKGWLDG